MKKEIKMQNISDSNLYVQIFFIRPLLTRYEVLSKNFQMQPQEIAWPMEKVVQHYLMSGYKIIKKEIKNEVEWLNAIQENFKEGV